MPQIWSTGTVPTQNDDVTLTGNNSVQVSSTSPTVHSLTLDSAFTGTLDLFSTLTVNPNGDSTGGLEMDNGTIDQPAGAGAPINVDGGYFNWSGGVLNSTTALASLNLVNVTAAMTAGDKDTGSTVNIGKNTNYDFNISGTWTFNNNSGITITDGGRFYWDVGTIATSGSGVIQNNGGTFAKPRTSGIATVKSDLPYVNNGSGDNVALLMVFKGVLEFTKAGPGPQGVSVLQNGLSVIKLYDGTTLTVDKGLTMNAGFLENDGTSMIGVGDVKIHGGTVLPGDDGIVGELDCDGAVTMDGGTLKVDVDLTTVTHYDVWKAKSFDFTNTTATLTVNSLNIPATLPKNQVFHILQTGAANSITGDFATKNLAIGNTGKSYTAGPDGTKQYYDLATPAN
jgi:hypothetical protein